MLPIQSELRSLANAEKAKILAGFFKTGKGQYAEGDRFLGIPVPTTRSVVRKFLSDLSFADVSTLLESPYHEERLSGVITLVEWVRKGRTGVRETAEFYLARRERINNWDLVDVSAPDIVGRYLSECLSESERATFVRECVESPHLWTNRIVAVASFYEIRKGGDALIFELAERFLRHPHDLMHKAVGWMLREA